MEHEPWIGERFAEGIDGQRLLLFGFSHYGAHEDGEDRADFTNYVMRRWALTGEVPFFTALASYFGETDVPNFYSRVAFANVLPRSVGDADDKFSDGGDVDRAEVEERVRRLIREVDPDKVIVFTTKGWRDFFPHYDDRQKGEWLTVEGAPAVEYGGYRRGRDGYAMAYGLRHPLFAPTEAMRSSVKAIMTAR